MPLNKPVGSAALQGVFDPTKTYPDPETTYAGGGGLNDGFSSDPAFRGLVAEDGSELVGYLLFSRTYDGDYLRDFYIADLYVRQASRGKGIGRMLMNGLRSIAVAEGVQRLSWAVHKNNAAAIRFYERLGFARTGRTRRRGAGTAGPCSGR